MQKGKMIRYCRTYRVKGFTITEVLVTLGLTSLVIGLSYTALAQVQKLFGSYREQNRFLSQYTLFKTLMDEESAGTSLILEESADSFRILRDSSSLLLELKEKYILLKQIGRCDTFLIAADNIVKAYEPLGPADGTNRLISALSFETEFKKQIFYFRFHKRYDASVKMRLSQNTAE